MKRILALIAGVVISISSMGQELSLQFSPERNYNLTSMDISMLEESELSAPLSLPFAAPKHVEFKYHGVYCVTDVAMAYDLTEKVFLKGINISGGWQWRRHSGFGVGISYLTDAEGVFSQMPMFLEWRCHMLRSQVTPFTSLTAGYTLPMGRMNGNKEMKREVIRGGVVVGLSIGARYAFNRNLAVNAYIGYQLQSLRIHRYANSNLEVTDPNYSRIEESIIQNFIKFGFGVNF